MLFLGHIGITAFIAALLYLPVVFAVGGVLLPDMVDKVLFLAGLSPCGRFFGHSIFFAPIIGAITYAITRRKDFAIAIMLGAFLHLMEDMTYFVPFLYPIKSYAFASVCKPIEVIFGTFQVVTELIGAGLIIFAFGFNSKFIRLRRMLWSKVFKNRMKKVLYGKKD